MKNMSNNSQNKKLTLVPLILMIFTSVFGFGNIPKAFYLMGYSAIPWYIFAALAFFIPYAYMMAEYGAAFKDEKGGIYSWMEKSVGGKYAFIGTFMWYASYVIWMVSVSSSILIPLSNGIFGKDLTKTLDIGIGSTQTLGIMAVVWMALVTLVCSKGLDKIKKITSIGGIAVTALNVILLIGALVILVLNGGKCAEPVTASAFFTSPNPGYQSPIQVLSFLVFAVFAFGGIEAVGGLVDQTENPERTFPKGVSMAAIIISVGYAIGIFMFGVFTDWNQVMSSKDVHLGNVTYVAMQNLGYQAGLAFNMSEAAALGMGAAMARFVGISMFLALTGAFFTLTFSPLKQLLEGTPKELWPAKMTELKDGMPKNAMWVQFAIVSALILVVAFGGQGASEFFTILSLMTNVAMTIPYMFLAFAFPKFKKKQLERPFEVYKSHSVVVIATTVVMIVVGFANLFTIIEPAVTKGDFKSTIYMIAGPLMFTVAALVIYWLYERRQAKNSNKEEKAA